MLRYQWLVCHFLSLIVVTIWHSSEVSSVEVAGVSCNSSEYLEPSTISCQMCPVNVSMVPSRDGFSCACAEHSVPSGVGRCRPCGPTELVSADGLACVPRKCQNNNKLVCRKCPSDYISVTQNFDGSPMKEMLCVKCARGFRARNNVCVRCASCACTRAETAVGGACVSKRFVNDRPKSQEIGIHPSILSGIVKNEYLCTNGDVIACRALASACVRHFYSSDLAGPCRLWIQSKYVPPKGLPKLVMEPTLGNIDTGEFILPYGKDSVSLALAVYDGVGVQILRSQQEQANVCSLPMNIKIGLDVTSICSDNITKLFPYNGNGTISPYLMLGGTLMPLPLVIRKPGEYYVPRGAWSSNNFRRYFLIDTYLSPANVTTTVYLQALIVKVR